MKKQRGSLLISSMIFGIFLAAISANLALTGQLQQRIAAHQLQATQAQLWADSFAKNMLSNPISLPNQLDISSQWTQDASPWRIEAIITLVDIQTDSPGYSLDLAQPTISRYQYHLQVTALNQLNQMQHSVHYGFEQIRSNL